MNFLGIDTSEKYLTVVAVRGEREERAFLPDCAARHSVVLTDEIDGVLSRVGMRPDDCDFFAVAAGPGSFTGIRIGISTVKGLCFSCRKPALAVTSFDAIAYAEESEKLLALIDAGHGFFYTCGYGKGKEVVLPPAYSSGEEVARFVAAGFSPCAFGRNEFTEGGADVCEGFLRAVFARREKLIPARELAAVYLRKSSAEEHRK